MSGWKVFTEDWQDLAGSYTLPQTATGFSTQFQVYGSQSSGVLRVLRPVRGIIGRHHRD